MKGPMKLVRKLAAVFAALALTVSLSGCAAESIDTSALTALIDVRTPAEFAAGHLEGAVNVDVQAADFTTRIDSFDKSGSYVIYCHSGRRAAVARDYMISSGFTDVVNAGGISDAAAATGLPVVQ